MGRWVFVIPSSPVAQVLRSGTVSLQMEMLLWPCTTRPLVSTLRSQVRHAMHGTGLMGGTWRHVWCRWQPWLFLRFVAGAGAGCMLLKHGMCRLQFQCQWWQWILQEEPRLRKDHEFRICGIHKAFPDARAPKCCRCHRRSHGCWLFC